MKTNPLIFRIVLGIGILLTAVFSTLPLIPPRAISAEAPAAHFSAERAMSDLAVIAKEPHAAGSTTQARVRDYISAQVESLGLRAEIQTSGSLANILVRIPGSDPTGTVIVTGHYDSHPPAPGAGDNGVSVAAMLETIHVLHAHPSLKNDVLFLFTDGEELGWLGATVFAREYSGAKQDSVVLCFDALPGNAPLLLQETTPGDAWLVRQIAGLPTSAWASSWKRDQERNEQDYDFEIFQSAGFNGMVFENEASGTRYHTSRDTTEAISPDLVQAFGKTMLTLTERFATIDLRTRTLGTDLMYVTLPLVGVVAYPAWVMSIFNGLGMLALFGFVIVGWQRKCFALGRFMLGLAGLALGITLMVVLAHMAWAVILKQYAAEMVAEAGFESSTAWLASLMAIAAVLMILLQVLLTRRLGGVNLTVAAAIIFLIVAFTFYFLGAGGNPFTIGWIAWSLLGCIAGLGILIFTECPAWKVALLVGSAFLMLTIPGPAIILAIYTREDAWLPVLIVAAWAGLFAPQVDAIFGHSINQDTSSGK